MLYRNRMRALRVCPGFGNLLVAEIVGRVLQNVRRRSPTLVPPHAGSLALWASPADGVVPAATRPIATDLGRLRSGANWQFGHSSWP